MAYRRMLYIFAIIKRNHFEVIMCVCFSHDTKHVHFEVISFYNSIMYNILRYVIARILRHMCNLHIKETQISKTKQGNQTLKDNLLCYFKCFK